MGDTALLSAQIESFILELVAQVSGQTITTTTTTTTTTTRRSSTTYCMLVNNGNFLAPRSSYMPELLIITL